MLNILFGKKECVQEELYASSTRLEASRSFPTASTVPGAIGLKERISVEE